MADEWSPLRLGDVCTKIGSGATPRGGSEVYLEQGPFALIRSQNVYNDGFHRNGLAYIGEKHAAELEGVEVSRNDVLLNITGDSVARACQVDPCVLPARVNQHVAIIRPDPEKLDPRFLRYVLVSPETQSRLLSWAGAGGTRNALTKAMIESLEVLAPKDVGEQRTIAHILGTLDDRIEANRRMNETLEAMARAIFKDWFVDFGPTRAKMEGRVPYLAPDIWSLFPDRLDDEGNPEGWSKVPLTQFFEIVGGGTPKTSEPSYWDGNIPWFSVVDTPAGSDIFVFETEKKITDHGLQNSSARLLDAGHTIISARGTVGKLAMAGRHMAFNQSCYGLKGANGYGPCFVFTVAQHMVSKLQSLAHGSVFSTITRQTFDSVHLPAPGILIAEQFESTASAFFERIRANVAESRTLAATRDLLLPKLMSGEVQVSEASAAVEHGLAEAR